MAAKDWSRIEAIFHDALDTPERERAAFLDLACGGDPKTREHVELLIAQVAKSEASFEQEFREAAREAFVTSEQNMQGRTIGHYEVRTLLGAGGMGEVYLARDTRLARDVAIKILPAEFALDRDRLARFKKEAQIIASLNHPNIAAIHELGELEGKPYLVLELVDGQTLAERLKRSALPLDEAMKIARQVSEGLEAAHARDIIHRDLKPANIKVTSEGKVKILDFGLAKHIRNDDVAMDSKSPEVTAAGMILGTATYMSPEQAKGQSVDQRTDIWSFGCVFYEMLTGRAAFDGASTVEILASIAYAEPDWSALPPALPLGIADLVRRCLRKDTSRRLHSIADARIQIEDAGIAPASPPGREIRKPIGTWLRRAVWLSAAMVLLALTLVLAAGLVLRNRPSQLPETWVELDLHNVGRVELSPDGRRFLFQIADPSGRRLALRTMDSRAAQPIAGTEGALNPFWSADGRSIGFFAGGKLKQIDLTNGQSQTLADAPAGRGGTWNRDGIILFSPTASSPLFRVPAFGGEPVEVTHLDPAQGSHRNPYFLPDGRHFLFLARGTPDTRGVYVGSLDGEKPKRLVAEDEMSDFGFAPIFTSGYVLFFRQGDLFAQRFDDASLQLAGDAFRVAERVSGYTAAKVNSVAYVPEATAGRRMQWFDRMGHDLGVVDVDGTTAYLNPEISYDGKRVAFERVSNGNQDIWLLDTKPGGVLNRLTFDEKQDWRPLWSRDGSEFVFTSTRLGIGNLYLKRATGEEELLFESPLAKATCDWSVDGRYVLFLTVDPRTGFDLWAFSLADRKAFPVVNTSSRDNDGQFSPDSRWIAYDSDKTGRSEVYVQRFPEAGGLRQISTNGGAQPRWRRDGKELFYVDLQGRLISIPVDLPASRDSFNFGAGTVLFTTRIYGGGWPPPNDKQQYAVAPDGQRFLINVAPQEPPPPTVVILNWKPGAGK